MYIVSDRQEESNFLIFECFILIYVLYHYIIMVSLVKYRVQVKRHQNQSI